MGNTLSEYAKLSRQRKAVIAHFIDGIYGNREGIRLGGWTVGQFFTMTGPRWEITINDRSDKVQACIDPRTGDLWCCVDHYARPLVATINAQLGFARIAWAEYPRRGVVRFHGALFLRAGCQERLDRLATTVGERSQ